MNPNVRSRARSLVRNHQRDLLVGMIGFCLGILYNNPGTGIEIVLFGGPLFVIVTALTVARFTAIYLLGGGSGAV